MFSASRFTFIEIIETPAMDTWVLGMSKNVHKRSNPLDNGFDSTESSQQTITGQYTETTRTYQNTFNGIHILLLDCARLNYGSVTCIDFYGLCEKQSLAGPVLRCTERPQAKYDKPAKVGHTRKRKLRIKCPACIVHSKPS
jgi:hypothetical protein